MPANDTPGYDFLTLTKPQWRHLRRIERDHGIPWSAQIRKLVKDDMDGKGIPSSGKIPKASFVEKRVMDAVERIELIFAKLEAGKIRLPAIPQSGDFEAVFDEDEQLKPSDLEKVVIDPNLLSDGSTTGDIKGDLMTELRAKMNLPPLERKAKPIIQFGSHIQVIDAPRNEYQKHKFKYKKHCITFC